MYQLRTPGGEIEAKVETFEAVVHYLSEGRTVELNFKQLQTIIEHYKF